MRVLTVSSLPDRSQGGVERLARELAEWLRDRGCCSTLVTNGPGVAQVDKHHYAVQMARLEARNDLPTIASLWEMFRSLWSVSRVLWRTRPDIVHVHFVDYPLLYWLLLRPIFRFKLGITGHGSEVTALLQPSGRGSLPRKLFPALVASCDFRTATSPQIALALATLSGRNVVTIENGIDVDFWQAKAGTSRNPWRLICVGRLSPEKGQAILLQALAKLARSWPQLECVIIGEGSQRAPLEESTRQLGLSHMVTFAGLLTPTKIRDEFERASIFVLPSLAEGLPLALLEAMAAGLAIVASNVGGVPDVVKDGANGILVAASDSVELAVAIRRLLNDRCERDRMASCARREASFHSLASTTEQFIRLYGSLVNPGTVRSRCP